MPKNKLNLFSCFNTIPACDGQTDRPTDRHTTIANTTLAQRRTGKMTKTNYTSNHGNKHSTTDTRFQLANRWTLTVEI